ncbi:MAG: SBBP repeat-containing protein [Chloroflexota bacterium]|nr:SBBP repeat-containing protein [Chloroflexota bacterium]
MNTKNSLSTLTFKVTTILTLCLALSLLISPVPPPVAHAAPLAHPGDSVVTSQDGPLMFVENVGQFPDGVHFYVYGADHTVWLAKDALWMTVIEQETEEGKDATIVNLKLSFPGANPTPALEPLGRLKTTINYYRGQDSANWYTGVPVWGGVRYKNLYPGTDLELTSERGSRNLTWRLVHRPDSQFDLQNVTLRVEGGDELTLEGNTARLTTAIGDVALPLLRAVAASGTPLHLPIAPSRIKDLEITAPFSRISTFPLPRAITSPQDNPDALLFSTFLGGNAYDRGNDLALGTDGAIYVTGYTHSSDFPTSPGAHDSSLGGNYDAFVTKLSADGSTLIYSTFLGGNYLNEDYSGLIEDGSRAIAVDGGGAAYVTGWTMSEDFPTTPGAFDTSFNGDLVCGGKSPPVHCLDAFVVKLDSAGNLAYATYLGGSGTNIPGGIRASGDDQGEGILVDETGIIYVTGWTQAEDFPTTPGAYDNVFADIDIGLNDDVFVVKLNPAGQGANDLLYSTFVGGGLTEQGEDIAIDSAGVVYVTGHAEGDIFPENSDFPITPGAYDDYLWQGDIDAFLFKLNPAGNGSADLLYSTFLGTDADWDYGHAVAVDAAGAVYVTGDTGSPDFPTTTGAFDTICGTDGECNYQPFWGSPGDAFVSKFDPAGNGDADLLYSTFLGGDFIDEGHAILVDGSGQIYVAGFADKYSSASENYFPVTWNGYDLTPNGSSDIFVTRLDPRGSGPDDLVYSTLLGGYGSDGPAWALDGLGLAFGEAETVLLAGQTESSNFPTTPGAYDTTYHGAADVFVLKLDVAPSYFLSGQVLDSSGEPITGTQISAGSAYSATTDASGRYTITVPPGDYTLTPATPGYFWSPVSRTVTTPPSATGQDFVGQNIQKQVKASSLQGTVGLNDTLTYTVRILYPDDRSLVLYDQMPTYTTYIADSLSTTTPTSVTYHTTAAVISGTMNLTATLPATVSFAVRVEVMGTVGFAPRIVNRACVYPVGGGLADCEWSNQVRNFTYLWSTYLPLVMKSYQP